MRVTDDSGISLAELIISVSLLLMVLAISYTALEVVYGGAEATDRQASFAREIGAPLNYLEEVTVQNLRIENPTAYSATFLTDANNDDVRERHIVTASTDGKLQDQVWLTNASGGNTTLVNTYVWGTANANRAQSVALFRYYTSAEATAAAVEITNMADVPEDARNMAITIVTVHRGRYLQDTRQVLLRNR